MSSYVVLALGQAEIAIALAALLLGAAGTFGYYRLLATRQRGRVKAEAEQIVSSARDQAANALRQAEIDSKAEYIKRREQCDLDIEDSRKQVREEERRLAKREDVIDQKLDMISTKERAVEVSERSLAEKEKALAAKDRQLTDVIAQQRTQLLAVARMTTEEATALLLGNGFR